MIRTLGTATCLLALSGLACTGGANADSKKTPTPGNVEKVDVQPYVKTAGGAALATVDGVEISEKELEGQLNRSNFQSLEEITIEKKRAALDKLIENELLYQEAKKNGFDQHPRVKLMMVSLLQREAVGSKGRSEIPVEDLQAYYQAHRSEYVIPEKVRARRILVRYGTDRSASKMKATTVRDQAASRPEEFAKLAREAGEGPERARSGELGFFAATGRPGLDQNLVDTAFKTSAGAVSKVFETAEGWNIIKVESRSERAERTFEQVRKSVERRLLAERRRDALLNYVGGLRNGAEVTVNDEKLAGFTPALQPRPKFPGKSGMPGMPGGLQPVDPHSRVGQGNPHQ